MFFPLLVRCCCWLPILSLFVSVDIGSISWWICQQYDWFYSNNCLDIFTGTHHPSIPIKQQPNNEGNSIICRACQTQQQLCSLKIKCQWSLPSHFHALTIWTWYVTIDGAGCSGICVFSLCCCCCCFCFVCQIKQQTYESEWKKTE